MEQEAAIYNQLLLENNSMDATTKDVPKFHGFSTHLSCCVFAVWGDGRTSFGRHWSQEPFIGAPSAGGGKLARLMSGLKLAFFTS
jgi:hypothetical protein